MNHVAKEARRGFLARLGNAQGWLCFHCGLPMLKTTAQKLPNGSYDTGWTREHVVPKSRGGFNRGNIVLAHLSCNSTRGNEPPAAHMMQRAKQVWVSARSFRRNKRNGSLDAT